MKFKLKKKKRSEVDLDFESFSQSLIPIWRNFVSLPGGPKERLQTREFRYVVEQVQKIQEKKLVTEGRRELGSYLLYYYLIHHAQALSLIQELTIQPKKVLDLGAGLGAFSLAALRCGAEEVTALDKDVEALELGAEICGREGYSLSIKKADLNNERINGKYDLIILGHTLDHIGKPAQLIEKLAKYNLEEGGQILLVDGSERVTNHRLLTLRDKMMEKHLAALAPCLWQKACPILQEGKTACYAQREFYAPKLVSEIQRSARIKANSLKMSYLVLGKQNTNLRHTDHNDARVITGKIDAHHGEGYFLCSHKGKKFLQDGEQKLRRGDLVYIEGLEKKEEHEKRLRGLSVRVKRPVGIPLFQID